MTERGTETAEGEHGRLTEVLNPEIGLVGGLAIGSFLLAAVIVGFTAAAYAEFSSVYQESGGGYMFVANTIDSNVTYIMGWTMILGYPASAAFYLASVSEWFFRFIYPVLRIPEALPFWIPGLLILALLVFINLKGTEASTQLQIIVTALKVVLLLFFLWGGPPDVRFGRCRDVGCREHRQRRTNRTHQRTRLHHLLRVLRDYDQR